MTPTELAERWQQTAVSFGAEACLLQIRDDVAQSMEEDQHFVGALKLLLGGFQLTVQESRSLGTLLASETGQRLAMAASNSPKLQELKKERERLQARFRGLSSRAGKIEAEERAVQALKVKKLQLERRVQDLEQRLREIEDDADG